MSAFTQPLNCDRKGCEASIYLDLSWCGTIAPTIVDNLAVAMSDLPQIYTALASRGVQAHENPLLFALLETVQGDLVINNAGNAVEKPTRTGLNRVWALDAVESVSQTSCCINYYIRGKRDVEITFDMAVDADYPGNEILFRTMCSKVSVTALVLSGMLADPNQQGWYGEWMVDTNNENEPATGDTMHNMSLRPIACGVCSVVRVRTEAGTADGDIKIINADTGVQIGADLSPDIAAAATAGVAGLSPEEMKAAAAKMAASVKKVAKTST